MRYRLFIYIFVAVFVSMLTTGFLNAQSRPEKDISPVAVQDVKAVENTAPLSQKLMEYTPENLTDAQKHGRAVLFFYANWCGTCEETEKDFEANQHMIPDDVTILKVDYMQEAEMKKRYGITLQDTFVQIDASENEIAKWNSGGKGIESLLRYLQ